MKRTFLFSALAASMLGAMAQGGYQDGIDYFKADYPDEAAIILNKTIDDPASDKALSYYYLGAIDLRKNNTAAAVANFDKGIAANPQCGYNYIGKGQVELMNGNASAAEKLFKEGISTNKKEKGALCAAVARAYFNVDPIKYAKKIENTSLTATRPANSRKATFSYSVATWWSTTPENQPANMRQPS